MSTTPKDVASQLELAPSRFLDQLEELRMGLSNEQLIAEAIEINHGGIGEEETLERYRKHLVHFSQYLASVHGKTFYTARRKHVRLFMGHLGKHGGVKPHESRLRCEWCKARGYPMAVQVQVGRPPIARATSPRSNFSSAIFRQRTIFLTTTLRR
jgi:hypothetical protein